MLWYAKNGVTKHTIKIIIKTINKEAYGILKEAYETICLNQKYKGIYIPFPTMSNNINEIIQ